MLKLDHIQLAVPRGCEDLCRGFWCGLLGLTEIEKPEMLRARGGVWFSCGDTEIHLGVEADFRPALKAHPAFRISDIDALAARLAGADLPVRWDSEIEGRRRFFTDDPVGNRLEFIALAQ